MRLMNASSLERMHERTLRTLLGLAETLAEAAPFPFWSRDRAIQGGEHTPAAASGGMFWTIGMNPNPLPAVDMRTLSVQQLDIDLRARQSGTAANE